MELNKQEYNKYVKENTPVFPLWKNVMRAFLLGGTICLLGQISTAFMIKYFDMEKETAQIWTQLELILASVILTGFHLYPKLVTWGGAGALVPITGFANSIAAPAIEYRAEGHVFGIGCKIFTIAGPVILFGVLSSWILGVVQWIGTVIGML